MFVDSNIDVANYISERKRKEKGMEKRLFTAERVMFHDQKQFATACEYGLLASAEELAEMIAIGERLGYFRKGDIVDTVFKRMAKVEDKLNGMSDLEIGGFYAEKLNEALVQMTEVTK